MTEPYAGPGVLAREPAAGGGEVVLRRRPDGRSPGGDTYELIVDGVFAMDTVQVSTELRLASETLRRLSGDNWRVLVGGLGFGYTLRELLADRRVASATVVELEPALVSWVVDGRVPTARGLLDDPRVEVTVGDVIAHLADLSPASYDAILLDVDNGPDFLVHQGNSLLYAGDTLRTALSALRPGGRLAIWSASASEALSERLHALAGAVEAVILPVSREGRSFDYVLYLAEPGRGPQAARPPGDA